jgi:flagellar hook-associated protein 3 FlgL
MRIATSTISESVLAQLQKLSTQQAKMQTQVSTGQKLTLPEDDPSAFGRVVALDTESRQLTQYQSNATRALEVSQATYSGLQSIKTISDRATEIATLGAGTSSSDSNTAYAEEVNQLIEQAVQQGNSKLGNDYIFAGTAVDSPPYAATRDATTGNITSVVYNGNTSQSTVQLSALSGVAPGSSSETNIGLANRPSPATDDPGFINNLIALRDALTSGSSTAVTAAQKGLEGSENLLVNSLSEQGAVQLRIQVNQSQQTARATDLQKLVSDETDADMATSVTQLSQTSTAYQAALSSASKILQTSLLDYLK